MSAARFTFTPDWQPNPGRLVEFELQPLADEQFERLRETFRPPRNGPTLEDLEDILRNNVTAWRGIDRPCNDASFSAILTGEGDLNWGFWLRQMSLRLFNRALKARLLAGD